MAADDLGDMQIQEIVCKATNKLLARMSEQGLYLYCKLCRTEHLFTWDELRKVSDKGEKIGFSSGCMV